MGQGAHFGNFCGHDSVGDRDLVFFRQAIHQSIQQGGVGAVGFPALAWSFGRRAAVDLSVCGHFVDWNFRQAPGHCHMGCVSLHFDCGQRRGGEYCEIYFHARPPKLARCDSRGASFSFPSGHAATIGAVAIVCVLRWPKLLPVALAGVVLVGLNRIMSQNHHITDVIVGVALGMTSALVVQWCWWKYQPSTFADMR